MSDNPCKCPHCGFYPPAKYKYFIDDFNVSILLKLWRAVLGSGENKLDVRNLNLTYGERSRLTQLRFHGLIAKYKENDKHVPAHWLITHRAIQFLKGQIVIPRYVITQDNRVIDHSDNLEKNDKDKWTHKADFKILKDFQDTHEIINDQLIKITQLSLTL